MFASANKEPIITSNDVVLFLSEAYLVNVKHGFISVDGISGVKYINGDSRYVVSYFGRILPDELEYLISHKNTLWDWLPVPGKVRNKTICNDAYQACMTAIYQKHGLYGLPEKLLSAIVATISAIVATMIIVGVVLGFMIEYFRVGPRAFLRDLKRQIRHDAIFPVYQPQVHIRNQGVVGVESLARWHDKKQGYVSPEIFISVAEDFNLIEALTRKLIIKVFHDLHQILEINASFKVSINISADLLMSHAFVEFLNDLTSEYRFNRSQVVLEVTERSVSNIDQMSEFSRKLKEYGYLISIDDFGTGVSNLSWLSMLEPNEIKIDKLFTHSIETLTVNNITLNGIFGMLEHLDARVVFEGIETNEQRDFISKKNPAAIGQGWLFAKPLRIEELVKFLDLKQVKVLAARSIRTVG